MTIKRLYEIRKWIEDDSLKQPREYRVVILELLNAIQLIRDEIEEVCDEEINK
jgi:hypothetical protein